MLESRSTWACELKWNLVSSAFHKKSGHAPRERVSWNLPNHHEKCPPAVTLHVSVWVEIQIRVWQVSWYSVTLHVSVWVEIVDKPQQYLQIVSHAPRERVSWNLTNLIVLSMIQKSRSTWACELKFTPESDMKMVLLSRSTWACELKLNTIAVPAPVVCHAPRERVSWNRIFSSNFSVVWVTLHVSVWVEISVVKW